MASMRKYFKDQKHKAKADSKKSKLDAEGQMLQEQEMKRKADEGVLEKAEALAKQGILKQEEMIFNMDKNVRQTNNGDVFMAVDRASVQEKDGRPSLASSFFSGFAEKGIENKLADIEEAAYRAQLRVLEMQYKVQYQATMDALVDYHSANKRGEQRAFADFFAMMNGKPEEKQETVPTIRKAKLVRKPFIKLSSAVKEDKQEEITVQEELERELSLESVVKPSFDFDSYRMGKRGVKWSQLIEEGKFKDALFALFELVESEGININVGAKFKKFNGDTNGAYQRLIKEGYKYKELVSEYRESK